MTGVLLGRMRPAVVLAAASLALTLGACSSGGDTEAEAGTDAPPSSAEPTPTAEPEPTFDTTRDLLAAMVAADIPCNDPFLIGDTGLGSCGDPYYIEFEGGMTQGQLAKQAAMAGHGNRVMGANWYVVTAEGHVLEMVTDEIGGAVE